MKKFEDLMSVKNEIENITASQAKEKLNDPNVQFIDVRDKDIVKSLRCQKAIRNAKSLMGTRGRILVRKSGTEQKIRIMAESDDKNLMIKCINLVKKSKVYKTMLEIFSDAELIDVKDNEKED